MKALKYKVRIQVTPVHRHLDRIIEEIWLPECSACANEEKHVFWCDEPRVPLSECEEIDINPMWKDFVGMYLDSKSLLDDFCERIFLTPED